MASEEAGPANLSDERARRERNDASESVESRSGRSGESSFPPEILENLPEDQRANIEQFFGSAMSMTVGMGNPIAAKITPEHITDIISLSSRTADLDYGDRRHSRMVISVVVGFALVILVAFGAFLAFMKSNELLVELIKIGAALAGGFGGGYGVASWRRR